MLGQFLYKVSQGVSVCNSSTVTKEKWFKKMVIDLLKNSLVYNKELFTDNKTFFVIKKKKMTRRMHTQLFLLNNVNDKKTPWSKKDSLYALLHQ